MNKEFTTYNQALALKELGYNEPCLAWYVSKDYGLEIGKVIQTDLIKDAVVAPTFSQAFRWFREKYGLHRHICYFDDTGVWHGDLYKLANDGLMNHPMELTGYKTYEETELACLIKLIEICKTKTNE